MNHKKAGISWAYHGHILGISQGYLGQISGISWTYLRHILGISQAYLMHISVYLRHIPGISRSLVKIGCQDLLSRLVVKIAFKIEVISSPSTSSVSIFKKFWSKNTVSVQKCIFNKSKILYFLTVRAKGADLPPTPTVIQTRKYPFFTTSAR